MGKEYADSKESCRSLQHSFDITTDATPILAPVAGVITAVDKSDQPLAGATVGIIPDQQPAFEIRISHVTLAAGLTVGQHVLAGDALGVHSQKDFDSDMALLVNTATGRRAVSMFAALTEAAMASYQRMGISSAEQMQISAEQRNAHPLLCTGGAYSNAASDPLPAWVALDPELVSSDSFTRLHGSVQIVQDDVFLKALKFPSALRKISVTDTLGRSVQFSATGLPAGITMDASTGGLSGSYNAQPLTKLGDSSGETSQVTVTAQAQGSSKTLSRSYTLFILDLETTW